MKAKERLLECKIKLKISSDYGLAKALGINRARVHDYMTAKRTPDAYTAIKMAEILGLHPLLLLAEFEAETEKNEERRNFWLNFGQRIKSGALGMLALISTAFWLPGQRAEAAPSEIRIMYIMSNTFASYWWLLIPLAILAWHYRPRSPR